ncbi:MAG: helix-turn-helix transcriptional regulator [Luteolibacter sp.]
MPDERPTWPDDQDHRFVAEFLCILKEARAGKGWTVRDVGERAGIDSGTVTRGENLVRIPGLVVLRKWVRALELDWVEVYREAEKRVRNLSE